jgi:hypothetical protein
VKSSTLLGQPFTATIYTLTDVVTGPSPANIASLAMMEVGRPTGIVSALTATSSPANKKTANVSRGSRSPLPTTVKFHPLNKEDPSLALKLTQEPNVARFGYSRRIPEIILCN